MQPFSTPSVGVPVMVMVGAGLPDLSVGSFGTGESDTVDPSDAEY
jgi:hypothetical protein